MLAAPAPTTRLKAGRSATLTKPHSLLKGFRGHG
jgi:hypothetical protein